MKNYNIDTQSLNSSLGVTGFIRADLNSTPNEDFLPATQMGGIAVGSGSKLSQLENDTYLRQEKNSKVLDQSLKKKDEPILR